jgi:hypothetical protein
MRGAEPRKTRSTRKNAAENFAAKKSKKNKKGKEKMESSCNSGASSTIQEKDNRF